MPRITSSTSAPSTPALASAARITWPPSTGASVSLKAPRKALPIGVRAVETMTASFMKELSSSMEMESADGVDHAAGFFGAFDLDRDAHDDLHTCGDLL